MDRLVRHFQDTRSKRIGLVHGLGNAVVLVLFALSCLLRSDADAWDPDGLALALSFAGAALSLAAAWMGGELVERLGVGVDPGAGLDAPSSLRHDSPQVAGRTGRAVPGRPVVR